MRRLLLLLLACARAAPPADHHALPLTLHPDHTANNHDAEQLVGAKPHAAASENLSEALHYAADATTQPPSVWRLLNVDTELETRARRSTRVLVEAKAPCARAGAAGDEKGAASSRLCPAEVYEFVLWGNDARKQLGTEKKYV